MNEEIKKEIEQAIKPQGVPDTGLQHAVQDILPRDQQTPPTPGGLVPSIPEAPKLDPNFLQKPLRTYESDLAAVMSKNKTSSATIAIAESKRKEETQRNEQAESGEPKKSHAKQILLTFLGFVFIGAGAFGGYYFYKKSAFARPPVEVQPIVIPSIIPYDKQVALSTTSKGDKLIAEMHALINAETMPPGKIVELSTGVSVSAFIQQAAIAVPDMIQRSITDRWMLGAYTEETGGKTIFIALSTDFFQNVFAGMLAWENTMPDDLATFFGYTQDDSYFNTQGTFSDKVIRNRDVREFRNAEGELLLLYSFVNKETLIITTTESALIAEIDRIEKQTYVR